MKHFLLSFIAASLLIAGAVIAVPPNNPSVVTVDAQAGLQRTATDCRTYAAGAAVNAWTNAPAEVLTVPILFQIRYIEVQNTTLSATPFASGYAGLRLGPSTDTPALTIADSDRLLSGSVKQFQVQRANPNATPGGTFPNGPMPLWIVTDSTIELCITYHW